MALFQPSALVSFPSGVKIPASLFKQLEQTVKYVRAAQGSDHVTPSDIVRDCLLHCLDKDSKSTQTEFKDLVKARDEWLEEQVEQVEQPEEVTALAPSEPAKSVLARAKRTSAPPASPKEEETASA